MDKVIYYLSGGFLVGRRTQLLAALGVLTALVNWAIGNQSGPDAINAIWQALASLSVGTLGAKVARNGALAAQALTQIEPTPEAAAAALGAWELAREYGDRPCKQLPNLTGDELLAWVAEHRAEGA
jgi:hypothetical protein